MDGPTLPAELKAILDDGDAGRFLAAAKEHYGDEVVLSDAGGDHVALSGQWVADTFSGKVVALKEFLSRSTTSEAQKWGAEERDFSADFWANPVPVYHCTTEENTASIATDGLKCARKTWGVCNRHMAASVFTSSELDDLTDGSYGTEIYRVDTRAMKADGCMPMVEKEPDASDADTMRNLAWMLGCEDFEPTIEQGISESTVIFRGPIPARYLTLEYSAQPKVRPPLNAPVVAPVLEH